VISIKVSEGRCDRVIFTVVMWRVVVRVVITLRLAVLKIIANDIVIMVVTWQRHAGHRHNGQLELSPLEGQNRRLQD
jgi:hypothetical protein